MFAAQVPALGYASYQIAEAMGDARPPAGAARAVKTDNAVILETDLFSISIDPAKGGRITSLFAKDLQREFVDGDSSRSFNELRGYFPNEGKWLSSVEAPAEVSIVEQGPLQVAAEIRGRIGKFPFVTRVSLATGRRRIDCKATFDFPVDVTPAGRGRQRAVTTQPRERFRLGEPWDAQRDTVRSNRRPFYDSSFKLQALFPAKLRQPTLDKNAPFDVCRAANSDTRFNAWDAIKNNVIFNWVDLLDRDGSAGLAVMSDHVTSYSVSPGEPLGEAYCHASGRVRSGLADLRGPWCRVAAAGCCRRSARGVESHHGLAHFRSSRSYLRRGITG